MFEMHGLKFEMKSVALSFAIILCCTLCHEAWQTCPPFPVDRQRRPCECAFETLITALMRRSLSQFSSMF